VSARVYTLSYLSYENWSESPAIEGPTLPGRGTDGAEVKVVLASDYEKLENILRYIAELPEEYVSGKFAHEWLLSNPVKHAVVFALRDKARAALAAP
jgi:hypothetical protein